MHRGIKGIFTNKKRGSTEGKCSLDLHTMKRCKQIEMNVASIYDIYLYTFPWISDSQLTANAVIEF